MQGHDPGMIHRNGRLISEDPLALASAGQLPDRPDVSTAIPNPSSRAITSDLPHIQLRALIERLGPRSG